MRKVYWGLIVIGLIMIACSIYFPIQYPCSAILGVLYLIGIAVSVAGVYGLGKLNRSSLLIIIILFFISLFLLSITSSNFGGCGLRNIINQEMTKQKYCSIFIRNADACDGRVSLSSIEIPDFDANRDGEISAGSGWDWNARYPACEERALPDQDNLAALMDCYYGVSSEEEGMFMCGCPLEQFNQQNPLCKGTARCFEGTVTGISGDGDTLSVNNIDVRLALIDAPDWNETGWEESQDFALSICPFDSNAVVDEDDNQKTGSYRQTVGVMYCNGKNLNEEMVKNGYATIDKSFCEVSEFADEEWTGC